MKDVFHNAILKGIENATNAENFISGIKDILKKCNTELEKLKVKPKDKLEFKFIHCDNLYTYRLGLPTSNEENNFSGAIVFEINGKQSEVMMVKNYTGAKYQITYLKNEERLDFPNIEKFDEIFHTYLSTASFGEMIYNLVKLS